MSAGEQKKRWVNPVCLFKLRMIAVLSDPSFVEPQSQVAFALGSVYRHDGHYHHHHLLTTLGHKLTKACYNVHADNMP